MTSSRRSSARLERVQQVIDEELAFAVQEARREGGDRAALADVILKLAGEVRQQLGLQLAISRTLVDLRVVKESHETVVEAIREESPDTARRIVARLKERRALRPSADLLPTSPEPPMAIWRDPLDELIADLECVTPVGIVEVFEMPPMEDYAVAVQSILSRDPVERERLAADPAVKRVEEYQERLARSWRSTGAGEPQV